MERVDSEALAEVGHHPQSRTLFVRFRSGELYAYLEVPTDVADAFLRAPSKGRFFQAEIDPVYRYVRVADDA